MDCMTWLEMCGNGLTAYMIIDYQAAFCAVVRGSITVPVRGAPAAAGTGRWSATTLSVFGSPGRYNP